MGRDAAWWSTGPSALPKADKPVARVKPPRDAAYWIAATRGMDFSKEDAVNAEEYNRVLWRGLMGNRPYPEAREGR